MSKTQVIQILLNTLKKRELTAEEAHKVLLLEGVLVSKRTVYRYLDTLETIPYEEGSVKSNSNEFGKKSWLFEPELSKTMAGPELTSFELMRCFVPKAILESRPESFRKLDSTIPKLFGSVGMKDIAKDSAEVFHNTGYFAAKPKNAYKDIDQIIESIKNGRKIEIHLTSEGYLSQTKLPLNVGVCPVKIIYHRGMFFLGLIADETKQIYVVGLDQIKAHSHVDQYFDANQQRESFMSQLSDRFGLSEPVVKGKFSVELLMENERAESLANQHWHHSQVLDKGEEMTILRFNCNITEELVNWVKERQAYLKILGPKELSDMLPSLSIH